MHSEKIKDVLAKSLKNHKKTLKKDSHISCQKRRFQNLNFSMELFLKK